MITEDDSGIILACQRIDRDFLNEKRSLSYPNLISNQMKDRRCLSLNDLSNQFPIWNRSASSESFLTISTNNPRGILKPLPFNQFTKDSKNDRMLFAVYEEKCSVKRKKESSRKRSFQSIEEDFHLLNRIFLRENLNELVKKPYLAIKYQQQSNIQKQLLKDSFYHPFQSNSTRNNSFHSSTIFI